MLAQKNTQSAQILTNQDDSNIYALSQYNMPSR